MIPWRAAVRNGFLQARGEEGHHVQFLQARGEEGRFKFYARQARGEEGQDAPRSYGEEGVFR